MPERSEGSKEPAEAREKRSQDEKGFYVYNEDVEEAAAGLTDGCQACATESGTSCPTGDTRKHAGTEF